MSHHISNEPKHLLIEKAPKIKEKRKQWIIFQLNVTQHNIIVSLSQPGFTAHGHVNTKFQISFGEYKIWLRTLVKALLMSQEN